MTFRGIFLADGPSDLPLAEHLVRLCAEAGAEVELTPIDPRTLARTGRAVKTRLAFLLAQGAAVDIVFVHRDAEGQRPEQRHEEILAGARSAGVAGAVVPVVPVRMTEAWLLLDETAIRHVAARPNGRTQLELPKLHEVESIADPKQRQRDTLLAASEASGRRRQQFDRDFGRHRALLLQRLDPTGPVAQVPAWRRLRADVVRAAASLHEPPLERR